MPKPRPLQKENLHIKESLGPKTTGHDVDFGTFTIEDGTYTPWITKLNKHEGKKGVDASILEVAFSEIALLIIKPGLTPPAKIVVSDSEVNQEVIGVASEHFNVQIKRLMDAGVSCYSFDGKTWEYKPIPKEVDKGKIPQERENLNTRAPLSDEVMEQRMQLEETQKGVKFLDKMPANFFSSLMKKHNQGDVVVDMESLASILTASYVLEEDDLHKGNIGFYVTDVEVSGEVKKKFTFFKIDHDLMFTDSIMSQKDMRIANVFYNEHSFKISTRDLDGFPDLHDSGNHYWPTKKRLVVAGDKAYRQKEERQAFAALKDNPDFSAAKWKYFLKAAIMPMKQVEKSLGLHLDPGEDADKINTVKNSTWSRMGLLKLKMLKSAQFKSYLASNGGQAFSEIQKELADYAKSAGMSEEERQTLMGELAEQYKLLFLCAKAEKISAVQKAILLDDYKFSITTNKGKPTPDEVRTVLDQFNFYKESDSPQGFKYACIAQHLIQKSDSDLFSQDLYNINQFKKDYLKPDVITTLKEFEAAADKIRASNLPLKQQKNELLCVLKEAKLTKPELEKLKGELKQREPESQSLKFINQKRSTLWLIRKIFGTYGTTFTSKMMIKEASRQINLIVASQNREFKKKHRENLSGEKAEERSYDNSKRM